MSETRRHIILISGAIADSKSVTAIMSAMRMTGAVPMLIADHFSRVNGCDDPNIINQHVADDIAMADGVIVMGNDNDIDPADYGETDIHPETNSEKATLEGKLRAAYEYKLLEETLKRKIPCFAVCGGMQRLNVLLGGTLHQHVPELVGTHYHHQGGMGIAPYIPVQYVGVVPGTRLSAISKELGGLFTPQYEEHLPPGVFMENSFHHQAVNIVGKGLIPCAFSIEPFDPDISVVQAVEPNPNGPYKDQFLIGVQWHPEFGASDVSARSLRNFDEQVRIYAALNAKNMRVEEALAMTAKSMSGGKWEMLKQSKSESWTKAVNAAMLKNSKPKDDKSR